MKTGVIKLDYSYNKIDLDNFIAIADRCVEDFEDGKPAFSDDNLQEDFINVCHSYLDQFDVNCITLDEEMGWIGFTNNGIIYVATPYGLNLNDEFELGGKLVQIYFGSFSLYRWYI